MHANCIPAEPSPPCEIQYHWEQSLTAEQYKPSSLESKGERPGLSVFLKDSNEVLYTYSSYARGLDDLLVTYRLLDLTPLGRQETKMNGWKLHDGYTDEETKGSGH